MFIVHNLQAYVRSFVCVCTERFYCKLSSLCLVHGLVHQCNVTPTIRREQEQSKLGCNQKSGHC